MAGKLFERVPQGGVADSLYIETSNIFKYIYIYI